MGRWERRLQYWPLCENNGSVIDDNDLEEHITGRKDTVKCTQHQNRNIDLPDASACYKLEQPCHDKPERRRHGDGTQPFTYVNHIGFTPNSSNTNL